jgi:FAD:protein FMN transferase
LLVVEKNGKTTRTVKITNMQRYTYPFRAMACDNSIVIDADSLSLANHAAEAAINEVKRIEAKYSRYMAESVITTINRQAGRASSSKIDAETALLLDFAESCYTESDGLFDITSGVLRRVWDFSAGSPPSKSLIDSILPLIGWAHVIRSADSISLPTLGMEIDFGGFGKEYAADRAAAVLIDQDIACGFVDLGGDVVVLGPQASGASWSLGVRHPRDKNQLLVTLEIAQGAVATSGDYERYFIHDGKRYSHILNPRTGMPVTGFQAVTVLAPSCMVAGSMSTIAMLKGEGEGARWLASSPFKALSVGADGTLAHYP